MAVQKKFKDLAVGDWVYILTPTTLTIKPIVVDAFSTSTKNPEHVYLNLRLDLSHKSPEITMDTMAIARDNGVDVGQRVIVPGREIVTLLAQTVPVMMATDKQTLLDFMKTA